MALATQCPHCQTAFRVAADQLKLRGGIVRCGTCHKIFDGNAHLIDLDAPPKPAPETPTPADNIPEPAPEEPPVYTLDFDATFHPLGILPKPVEPEQALPFSGSDPAFGQTLPFSGSDPASGQTLPFSGSDPAFGRTLPFAGSDPGPESGPEPVPEPEPAPAPAPAAPILNQDGPLPLLRQAAAVDTIIDPQPIPKPKIAPPPKPKVWAAPRPRVLHELPPPEPDPDEPEFLKRGRELERTGNKRRIALIAGSAALAVVLVLQAATTFRNTLAARHPALAPALSSLCASLGCKLELPMQIDALSIETGELQTLGADTFSLTALLRNQSALNQAWPYIELELTDAVDKPMVRRVFGPAEYLAPGTNRAAGFAARSEQPVKLYFQLKDVKASGYHIAVFYP